MNVSIREKLHNQGASFLGFWTLFFPRVLLSFFFCAWSSKSLVGSIYRKHQQLWSILGSWSLAARCTSACCELGIATQYEIYERWELVRTEGSYSLACPRTPACQKCHEDHRKECLSTYPPGERSHIPPWEKENHLQKCILKGRCYFPGVYFTTFHQHTAPFVIPKRPLLHPEDLTVMMQWHILTMTLKSREISLLFSDVPLQVFVWNWKMLRKPYGESDTPKMNDSSPEKGPFVKREISSEATSIFLWYVSFQGGFIPFRISVWGSFILNHQPVFAVPTDSSVPLSVRQLLDNQRRAWRSPDCGFLCAQAAEAVVRGWRFNGGLLKPDVDFECTSSVGWS